LRIVYLLSSFLADTLKEMFFIKFRFNPISNIKN